VQHRPEHESFCDNPACQASAADLRLNRKIEKVSWVQSGVVLLQGPRLRHRPEHESFCEELTQICDYPGCEEQAYTEAKCRQCKVAMYCSKKHRSKHASAHESLCEELCALR
jgi:hypothetical protein